MEPGRYRDMALALGRPLDSVVILMAGASGCGKSSTINTLLDDRSLCKTNSLSSETKDVTIIRKFLTVGSESPALSGYLSFIDVPGIFDTDSTNEAQNLATIRKLKESPSAGLKGRTLPSIFNASIRNTVYPNVILFAVNATDNRMEGPDSFLAKSLRAFKNAAGFIDLEKGNLIVVLTHVMTLPRNRQKFMDRLNEKTVVFQQQFETILGISNVPVVPIENEPEDYDLEKDGDFYRLPNGQRTHKNLLDAMLRVFDRNGDLLASQLTRHYFYGNCPERSHKAEIKTVSTSLDAADINRAAEDLDQLNILIRRRREVNHELHPFVALMLGRPLLNRDNPLQTNDIAVQLCLIM